VNLCNYGNPSIQDTFKARNEMEQAQHDIYLGKVQPEQQASPRGLVVAARPIRGSDPSPAFLIATRHLLESVCEAADEKKLGPLASFALERAILETVDALGLSELVTEKLRERVWFCRDEIPLRQYSDWFGYLDEALYQRLSKQAYEAYYNKTYGQFKQQKKQRS
jgi:hypothetical protein